ncbi:MAG TPA: biotin--[acetyl-CoA-carboxylase] ligase [Pyrinomonadaceae bacterium]|nr:biotin--[acetyl-CoA-carboxylase] ligase [Pyrinomonadaceae bacterium]
MSEAFQPTVLRFDSLPSTNTEALRQAVAGAPEGLCIVAREQTEGRGRLGRAWASPAGAGLYCSILLRPQLDARVWPLLPLAAALAVADALRETCSTLVTDIKWPNDIHTGGRKICGILAESAETPAGRACVLGIGINLRARAYPAELSATATSVEEQTGATPDAEAVLRELVTAVARRYALLQEPTGASAVVAEWSARSSYAEGKRVRVSLGAETFEGTTRGLEADGALRVETTAGELRIIRAGDVSALRDARAEAGPPS